ncbi:MAG: hypothetical protein KBD12_02495 [Candidatus Pacebacteria bacterium]|nr:hypothetical protein [Candidatus Paceibacterota bacterium]
MEKKENYNLLVAKKTEKIVTAIYLISQFLSERENIKYDLRKEANLLLKNINSIAFIDDKNFEDSSKNIFVIYKSALDSVSLIISYLFVAKDSNLISRMNVDILIDGLRMLENILIKKQFSFGEINLMIQEESALREVMFDAREGLKTLNSSFDAITERNKITESANTINIENIFKKSLNVNKEIKSENQNIINDIYKKQEEVVKDNLYSNYEVKAFESKDIPNVEIVKNKEIKTTSFKNEEIKTKKPRKSENRKQDRRGQIISLFTKGVEISIHDISKKVIGCSVKTLQRELNSLVLEKKIDRIGDKRWSKYILL